MPEELACLSPGTAWQDVPTDHKDNPPFRRHIQQRCRQNARFRAKALDTCAHDILYYINVFGNTFRPKQVTGPRVVPFITWPIQVTAVETFVKHIEDQRALVVEKSRDVGASWIACYVAEWLWRWHAWTKTLMISRLADLVDSNDPDSLFWKIDFIHEHQPEWLLPEKGIHSVKFYRENLDNRATLTGQATTEKSGIGGRATMLVIDELSRIDKADEVWKGTADTADCRIAISTHTGPGTTFNRICNDGVTDKLVMHWSQHVEKARGSYKYNRETKALEVIDKDFQFPADFPFVLDGSPGGGYRPGIRSPWYDRQCRERGSKQAIAMDLDIDVKGSTHQFIDVLLIRSLQNEHCCPPYWRGDLQYDPDTGRPDSLISSPGGLLMLWCIPNGEGLPPRGQYVFGCDIAAGSGATPSCVTGFDCVTGEKVLEYADARIDPKKLAPLVAGLCWLFKDEWNQPARLAWEVPGPGLDFGGEIMKLGFGNIYYNERGQPFYRDRKTSDRPGWVSTVDTKPILLKDYRAALSKGQFINRSERALEEFLNFEYNPTGGIDHAEIKSVGDPSGANMNHADRVIADALAWMLAKGSWHERKKQEAETPVPGSLAWRRLLHEGQARKQKVW